MNILYLTTSVPSSVFSAYLSNPKISLNPSGQNFHRKMIKALRQFDHVEVLSLCPSFINDPNKEEGYHYVVPTEKNGTVDKVRRIKSLVSAGLSIYSKGDKPIIIFDPLSIYLSQASKRLSSKLDCPRVAILTDNPRNLSKSSSFVTDITINAAAGSEGFLALSTGLLIAYDVQKAPHVTFEGIEEDLPYEEVNEPKGSFLYFGGALYERYGITDLLSAFMKSKLKYKLLIAGHGPLSQKVNEASLADNRIVFLGELLGKENFHYEQNAALNINPRRFSTLLDAESVPSKVLEYIVSGEPVLSTWHSKIESLYPNDVNWLEESGEEPLRTFFLAHTDNEGKLIGIKPNNAKEKALARYSLPTIGAQVHSFLMSLNSSSN